LRNVFLLIVLILCGIWWGTGHFSSSLPEGFLSGKKNVLVLGCDVREGDTGRSDTLFVVMLDPDKKDASLLSIPRDTRVKIKGHGWDKINHAFAFGGHELSRSTVQDFLGIKIDNYVMVDFSGFVQLIDTIGGVDIDVEKSMSYYDPYADFRIDLQKGPQHLDGKKAIQYVRYRDEEGDIGRIRRQQKFILAVYDKIRSEGMLARLPGLAKQIMSMIETDLSMPELAKLAKMMHSLVKGDRDGIKMAMVPGDARYISGVSYWIPDVKKTRDLMADLQDVKAGEAYRKNTDATAREYADSLKSGTKKEEKQEKKEKTEPEKTKAKSEETKKAPEKSEKEPEAQKLFGAVRLLNCTGSSGAGTKAKKALEKAGFAVIDLGRGETRGDTLVRAEGKSADLIRLLRKIPFAHRTVYLEKSSGKGYDATILLGRDYE